MGAVMIFVPHDCKIRSISPRTNRRQCIFISMVEFVSMPHHYEHRFPIPTVCLLSSLIYQEMENKQKAISATHARLKELRAWAVSTYIEQFPHPTSAFTTSRVLAL